jgi:diguanylate cyclase (GGDEF)-like protein
MDKSLILGMGIAFLVVGAAIGMLFMRLRVGPKLNAQRSRADDLTRRVEELSVAIQRTQSENKNLSAFLVMLPDVARRLNSHLDKRNIAPLLASVLQHIFEPGQIMVFFTNKEEKFLYLAYKTGVPERVPLGMRVGMTDGMLGWVATHQVTMDKEDFHNQTGSRRGHNVDVVFDPSMSIELIAPMSYENECLGIVCVGGISKRPSDHKRMIKMVADFGTLAVANHNIYTSFQSMANSDQLTKLYTKRFLLQKMGEEIHKAEQLDQPLSVFIFDIDHFKKYNDTHGHLAGDEVLRLVGRLVRQEVREEDTAARYGGEEFVVVLPNTTKENGIAMADKIRKVIEGHPFPNCETQPLGRITISGGVATLGHDGRTTNELLGAADQALYLSKDRGRNRVTAYKIKYLSDEEEVPA